MGNDNRADWTIARLLEWTTDYFGRHGSPSARLDAEVLLAHALEVERLTLYIHFRDTVPKDALQAFRSSIERRIRHEPVAYITGKREFYSIPFAVGPGVLIPRPETEHLVEYALREMAEKGISSGNDPIRILDVGTGSGNVSVALARHLPRATILALDISASALKVARRNLKVLGAGSGKVRLLQSDFLEALHPARARFHLIVSNPPYIARETMDALHSEVRDHEPSLALDGGPGGTVAAFRILCHAPAFLSDRGLLLMEIGEDQGEALSKKVQESGMYTEQRILPDYAGKPRVLVARKG